MKNKLKLMISIIILILSVGLIVGTIICAKNNLSVKIPEMGGMEPPSMNNSNQDFEESMEIPSDGSMMTPPEKPSGENTDDSIIESGMPQMNGSNMGIPQRNISASLTTGYIVSLAIGSILFALSLIYLIMSSLGKNKIFENKEKIIIYILLDILISILLTYGLVLITNNYILNNSTSIQQNNQNENETVDAEGEYEIDGETKSENHESYSSEDSDENVILVTNGGNLSLTNATISKLSGDTTNTENSEFNGINAAVLVQSISTLKISNSTINTSAKGSNAIFSTGTDSKIYISDTKITTTSDSSRGLDATYGGYIEADNVTISTQGGSCGALATDRGEGTVKVTNSTLSTAGAGSPIIYSTGDISLSDSTGTATKAQMVVIEGKNSATISNSTLNAYGIGNRGDVDNSGVMIYQSMSGDASEGTGTLNVTDSTLTLNSNSSVYKTAPMFFITNTDAIINLTNTKLSYGSNTLLSIKGTDEWGTTGNNGGNLTFNATKETLSGNIEIDSLSTLVFNLTSSSYSGTINSDNTANSVTISLDKDSTWNVTGNSHIKVINDIDTSYNNIKSNGYTIYYDIDSNTSLNGKTITLSDGGKLIGE